MTAPPRTTRPNDLAHPDQYQPDQYQPDQYQPDQYQLDTTDRTDSALPTPIEEEEQRFSLSATQITASMAAAVTAAMIGSKLGVAGTVIGAGLASVISGVGGAVFGHSIAVTSKQVKRAVLQVRGVESPVPELLPGPERIEPRRPRPTRRKLAKGLIIGTAAASSIFIGSLATVTLVETVKGSPLSGGDSGGLSVLGGSSRTDPGTVEAPVDSTTQMTPSTVTQTATSEPASPPSSSEPSASASDSSGSSSAPSSSAASSSAASSSAPSPSTASSSPAAPSTAPATTGAAASTGATATAGGTAPGGATSRAATNTIDDNAVRGQ